MTTTFEMGPVQRQIVELLRTTQAEQMRGEMIFKQQDGTCIYCVMGLLAHKMLGLSPRWNAMGYGFFEGDSPAMLAHMGMTITGRDRLIRLNDTGMTFHDMALEIEAYPERYFDRAA